MSIFGITSFFAGLFGVMLIALSLHTIRMRQELCVLIGDGGYEKMQRAIRAQANFCEYVPFALLMMALLESKGTGRWLLVLLGLALFAFRICHAYSLLKVETDKAESPIEQRIKFRSIGIVGTFGVIALESLMLLF